MPTLTYHDGDATKSGRLTGRVLVGRRLSHGVVLADPGVSRLHAWVDRTPDGGWAVADAGSKTGTTVNGKPADRHVLAHGDVVTVGATRIAYSDTDELPAGAEIATLSPPRGEAVRTSGVLFDCPTCSAPIWVGPDLAGKRGRCRHCKSQVVVPAAPVDVEPRPTPVAAPAADGRPSRCGVCHAGIAPAEDRTVCPECDTTYHAECWAENYGCSTYGCGRVNALNPAAKAAANAAPVDDAPPADDVVAAEPAAPMQWEWLTVLAAFVASVLGVMTFGIPPLVVAAVAAVMIVRRQAHTRVGLLALAVALSLVGVAAGLVLSDYLLLNARHLPGFAHH